MHMSKDYEESMTDMLILKDNFQIKERILSETQDLFLSDRPLFIQLHLRAVFKRDSQQYN